MSYILIISDDAAFGEVLGALINRTTSLECITLGIDDQKVFETLRALDADVYLMIVSISLPNDPGGLELLWLLNECFPIWCITDSDPIRPYKPHTKPVSNVSKRQLLELLGCQKLFFKPLQQNLLLEALREASRVPGGA